MSARTAWAAIRRANAPGTPEDSIAFRVTTGAAVLAGVAACAGAGEIGRPFAAFALVAISAGMLFSHLTRAHPWQWLKVPLAAAVIGVFATFVLSVFRQAGSGDLASVEAPLAVLFVWVQILHSLDVPARRDLLFSLAASAASIAIAGTQAVDTFFAPLLALWFAAFVSALVASWRSVSGAGGGHPAAVVLGTGSASAVLAAVAIALLPSTSAAPGLRLPASLTSHVGLADPGQLAGGASGAEPVHPGSPSGRIGVGGYDGFAGPLDTALRGSLGNFLLFRVRATRPAYFLGMTYDRFNGTSWLEPSARRPVRVLSGGSPFEVGTALALGGAGPMAAAATVSSENVQTFYVAAPMPNLVLGATQAEQVWFPDRRLYVDPSDNSLRTGVAVTPGTVYTVVSADTAEPPAVLAGDPPLPAPVARATRQALAPDLTLARPYRRVHALTVAIIGRARARTTYAKVAALEAWMAGHVRYSTQIPPLLPGQDAVNHFLFGPRVGYCEQISTALAVMLRTVGIPAREATGYVPGSFNPLTDLFDVRANDAHAWVQVWFPHYGWQSFDPTADVPLAAPSPGAVIGHDLWALVRKLPAIPAGSAAGAAVLLPLAGLVLRRRPLGFVERVLADLDRAASRSGQPRRASETLSDLAGRLTGARPEDRAEMVAVLERAAYGGPAPSRDERRRVAATARVMRSRRSRSRSRTRSLPGGAASPADEGQGRRSGGRAGRRATTLTRT